VVDLEQAAVRAAGRLDRFGELRAE